MHEEHLILVIVMMPHELARKRHERDVPPIQFADDLRRPMI
jgi:hypothetical protein